MSSTTQAAVCTSSASGSGPASAASSTSSGRKRLPPAVIRWVAASRDVGRASPAVLGEQLLDARQPTDEPLLELGVDDGQGEGRVAHLMNSPATAARSSTGPGSTPSTSVTAAPTAMVVAVSTEGYATLGPSPTGSSKYMTLMTLM